jgi:hypothetical protein
MAVAGGNMYALSTNDNIANTAADSKYGTSIRRKLIPALSIAIISLLPASFDVKNITDINMNKNMNILA